MHKVFAQKMCRMYTVANSARLAHRRAAQKNKGLNFQSLILQEHPAPDQLPFVGSTVIAVDVDGVADTLAVPSPSEGAIVGGLTSSLIFEQHFFISLSLIS